MSEPQICVVVPTYNNGGTLADVLRRIGQVAADVIVVNDGSTDETSNVLAQSDLALHVVSFPQNRGKGKALAAGFEEAKRLGYTHAVTIDSDGQHYPEDIPLFTEACRQHPDALIVGERDLTGVERSKGSNFANRFSNFWFWLQTGQRLGDTQTGFRLYPLRRLPSKCFLTARYEAELALLVLMAWAGVPLRPISVRVFYPPKDERVSHFRPYADFARIFVLNLCLCAAAVVYGWPRMLLTRLKNRLLRTKKQTKR